MKSILNYDLISKKAKQMAFNNEVIESNFNITCSNLTSMFPSGKYIPSSADVLENTPPYLKHRSNNSNDIYYGMLPAY